MAARALLIADASYVEHTNGASRSIRTIMEWLHDGGLNCSAVASGRFDQSRDTDIREVHDALPCRVDRRETLGLRPVARFRLNGVAVAAVETRHVNRLTRDEVGDAQFSAEVAAAVADRPDIVLAYGSHPAVQDGLAQARAQGARTIYTVRAWGYEDPRWYRHADRVLMNSSFAVGLYRERTGVRADWLPSPFVWSEIEAPVETRGFVTFVNPALHKGLALMARLIDMLGRRRPDIPVLIVQSGGDASILTAIPGLDLASHPQVLVSPPIARPRDIFALTRILLAPSAFAEPFGRVAAEAMINGIPPIVSDRGGLPETVDDGGIVLPMPDWLGPKTTRVPSEAEVEPWFAAVTRLWDDEAAYARASAAARLAAIRLYDEAALRRRYLDYFLNPGPFPPVLPAAG